MSKSTNKKSQDSKPEAGSRYISKMSLQPSKGQQPRWSVWDTKMGVFIEGTSSYSEEATIECADRLTKEGYSEE